jgi:tetratricopeptide (TPR) repeat protein
MRDHPLFLTTRNTLGALLCLLLLPCSNVASAQETSAEVVQVVGTAEHSADNEASWQQAAVNDKLAYGSVIRTAANSQAALLFPGASTQRRIGPASKLQIKPAAAAAGAKAAAVKLMKGKMWSNARPRTAPGGAAAAADLGVETPTATMSIRGTDWMVEVAEDGTTELAVLSGVVEIGNSLGSLTIGAGEAAVARPGAAPVKLTLVDPETRVQWISSWMPRPAYWAGADAAKYPRELALIEAGDYSGALAALDGAGTEVTAALLAADLQIHQGELAKAIARLEPHAADPRAAALRAHALARADRLPEAAKALDSALATQPEDVRLLLARGDIAVLEGDAATASRHYARAVERSPQDAEAWYGLGLVAAEREEVREARRLLGEALKQQPGMSKAAAELAAVDTFAGALDKAAAGYDAVLQSAPADYVALTGRGINRLKAGEAEAALADFLRAGVIEPRYARAQMYSGVAFYQLGDRKRATEAFERAAALDALDPLPWLLKSVLETDALDYPAAIAAAREAEQRMPYLKSLNQVANDQKGNANLGTALAEFGLEQWATQYAYEAYSPFWAGSHLFLADRYTGQFSKNSELFKGFITDPTVFGASNRESALVSKPGHYAELAATAERQSYDSLQGEATANGMVVSPVPLAYYVNGQTADYDERSGDSELGVGAVTLGLGLRPRHDLGLFGFFTDNDSDFSLEQTESRVEDFAFSDTDVDFEDTRGDLGLNYKIGATRQLWLKGGRNEQHTRFEGELYAPSIAELISELIGRPVAPTTELSGTRSDVEQEELQFRYAAGGERLQWSLGAETSQLEQSARFATLWYPLGLKLNEDAEVQGEDYYLAGRFAATPAVELQLEGWYQRHEVSREQFDDVDILTRDPPLTVNLRTIDESRHYNELNPRIALTWRPRETDVLRLAAQRWRRPAGASTLGAVDTLGIALNDQLPIEGGEYERVRLQYESEPTARLFLQAFVDHEEIANGLAGAVSVANAFELRTLQQLLNQPDVFAPLKDLEDTPLFESGTVDTVGLAGNFLLGTRASAAARYLWRDSEQEDRQQGLEIPLVPEHYLELRGNLSLPHRVLLGAHAVYRDERYEERNNVEQLDAGWAFGATAYWETADKRASVYLVVDNLLPDDDAGFEQDTHYLLKASYRF